MKRIKLTEAATGEEITGWLPEGWHEVPLSAFIEYQSQAEGKPAAMRPLILATVLTGLPGEALAAVRDNVAAVPLILAHLTWADELPEPMPANHFEHGGKEYMHVGNLDLVNMGQFEALLTYLESAEGNTIAAAPHLLAVLYQEVSTDFMGKVTKVEQNAVTVAAVAEAFKTLPMVTAWSALAFFLTSSVRSAQAIQTFSRIKKHGMELTGTLLEAMAAASPSQRLSSRIAEKLANSYIKSARRMLGRL